MLKRTNARTKLAKATALFDTVLTQLTEAATEAVEDVTKAEEEIARQETLRAEAKKVYLEATAVKKGIKNLLGGK